MTAVMRHHNALLQPHLSSEFENKIKRTQPYGPFMDILFLILVLVLSLFRFRSGQFSTISLCPPLKLHEECVSVLKPVCESVSIRLSSGIDLKDA